MLTDIKLYLRYVRGRRGIILASVLLSLAQAALLVPIALIVQGVFDQALPNGDAWGLAWRVGLIPILFAVNGAVVLLNRALTLRAVKSSVAELRGDLLEQAAYWSRETYARLDAAATHARIVQDTERIDCMASAFLSQFVPGVMVSVALTAMLLRQDVGLSLLLLLALPLAYGANRLVGAAVKKRVRRFHEDFSAFSKGVLFILQFSELVTNSTAEGQELARQRDNIDALRTSSGKMALLYTAYGVIQSNVLVLVAAVVLLIGGLQVLRGGMTIGVLLSFYVNLNLLSTYLRNAFGAVPTMIEGAESLRTLLPFLAEEPAAAMLPAFARLGGKIEFKAVSFHHPDSTFALRDVNFVVNAGELFGIFGPSGSGKTTLIRLLTGVHRPHSGRIVVDGQEVGTVDGTSFRRRVGVLSQNPLIFPGTVRENLTYGLPAVDEGTLREACRVCRIDAHVASLPQGYDSEVGEAGATWSGGQKQRLALARALLRAPDLLILDEPDNNLDTDMIRGILADIRMRPMTVILITHDERLLSLADRHYRLV